jgi:photosystem II stability/assembly factor-like uncharacterized protein
MFSQHRDAVEFPASRSEPPVPQNLMVYTRDRKATDMKNLNQFELVFFLAIALAAPSPTGSQEPSQPFAEMQWRLIGPFRGGRALAASGVPGRPNDFYFGAVAGGVWKTSNAGRTWQPIFDGQPIASIGAIAIAPSDPQTIYVGSGEADMRSDISFGDGMYKSIDDGATWRNIGLRESRQISRILVDPRDQNIVLVAALGHGFGPNPERGVYRSQDGGSSWQKVLGKNDNTGAIDLCFDPGNSRIVYAALWQARRPPWSVYAPTSGPDSGLYKSTDGGITWQQIRGGGFPTEGVGRIGIAVAPGHDGSRVYALVDAREGGVYRSDDKGQTWRRVSSDHRVWQRGWYFGGITADPRDPNTIYIANTSLYRSTKGGENFEAIEGAPGGNDYHSLWIAPDDPRRMILATDQGVIISVDGARTWSSWFNQPTAQMYHVTTDDRFPYRVYGSQQDSGTAAVSSRSDYGQITFRDWAPVGGEESGYIAIDPDDPNTVYGGGPYGTLSRFDWITGESLTISPQLVLGASKLRFTWTSPVVFSPQRPHVLYLGAQFVLRTADRGITWQTISPDLTVNAKTTGDAASKDQPRGVVYTIAPSPIRAGTIWAGTDNGLIQLTLDEGKTWTDVTPATINEWTEISLIEGSHFDAATAYAALNGHQIDDIRPYIYRTHDYGKTWQKVTSGIPANAYVHVVREDPVRKGLLFAGTELGAFVSLDDGDRWQPLQMNLPVTSVRDLAIHGDDLVAATHGRSFWILDDISPLREYSGQIAASNAYLFHPAKTFRLRRSENRDTPLRPETPVGTNPPAGAMIDYSLKSDAAGSAVLEIRDSNGNLVRRFSSDDKPQAQDEPPEFPNFWLHPPQVLSKMAGVHRFIWDLRYPQPAALRYEYSMGAPISSGTVTEPMGPLVLPGDYEVKLIVGGKTLTQTLNIEMDPRDHISRVDLVTQLDLEQKIDAALSTATHVYREVAEVRSEIQAVKGRLAGNARYAEIARDADDLDKRAEEIAGHHVEWPASPGGFVELERAFTSLATAVGSADSAPTTAARETFDESQKKLIVLLSRWAAMRNGDLALLNERLRKAGVPPVGSGDSGKPVGE